jgi:hypothetical protein
MSRHQNIPPSSISHWDMSGGSNFGGHFWFWAPGKLADIFGRDIGANFPSKWSRMLNPLRKKVSETKPNVITLM